MNDYISRQTMLDAVEKLNIIPSIDGTGKPTPSEDFRVQFLGTVIKVPTADVVPVVHGYWIRGKYTDDDLRYNDYSYRCNRCRKIVDFEENFCPNCGAKMDGGGEDG